MHNGIGLTTPRGSGTNGYAQANKFIAKSKPNNKIGRVVADQARRPVNKEILEHQHKREIELKSALLEENLVDHGYDTAEIAHSLVEVRRNLEADAKQGF